MQPYGPVLCLTLLAERRECIARELSAIESRGETNWRFTMSEATLDEKIEFATTVLSVMRKRLDLDSYIMAAHRDLIRHTRGEDPFTSNMNLAVALADIGVTAQTEAQRAALLELYKAILHAWYKVSPEFKSWISKEFVLSARLRGEDEFSAQVDLDRIVGAARGYGEVQREHEIRLKAERHRRQQEREKQEFERAKAARQRENLHSLNAT